MADIIEARPQMPHTPPEARAERGLHVNTEVPSLWSRLALGGVMLVSVFMNFFQLGQNGFGNLYYAAVAVSKARLQVG